jgi:hypothetical protein
MLRIRTWRSMSTCGEPWHAPADTSGFRKRLLIALVGLALLAGAFLWVLPEIARRVAQDRIARVTGRPAASPTSTASSAS